MAEYNIKNSEQFLSYVNSVMYGGPGMSISEKESGIRNASIKRNGSKTRYGIDTVSLTSEEYDINRYGKLTGSVMVGENADPYANENNRHNDVDSYGGVAGYNDYQENADDDVKITKGAQFKNGITENNKFIQGASFINPTSIDRYDIDERNDSIYTTSSVNNPVMTNNVKGAYKYEGTNEDLLSWRTTENTNVHGNYQMYNEDGLGVIGGANSDSDPQTLDTNDVIGFIENDSSSDSSLIIGDEEDSVRPKTLVGRTSDLFRYGKIGSIVSRFKTGSAFGGVCKSSSSTGLHGMSRGRNLLSKNSEKINGYDNPYCRVWTNHYQYSKHTDLIRPFLDENGDSLTMKKLYEKLPGMRGAMGCEEIKTGRLDSYSVLEDNGHVTIAPYESDYEKDEYKGIVEKSDHIKKYMFSIENLAWKGYTSGLSAEQKGPNGGRIMWFPPYNLKFNDSVNADWSPTTFIGRGEEIYTYSKTKRTSSISFDILVDHPSIIDAFTSNAEVSEENEQKLLRFFAGCESGLIKEVETIDVTVTSSTRNDMTKDTEPNPNKDSGSTEEEYFADEQVKYVFVPVFFPNNFTGTNYLEDDGTEFTYKDGVKRPFRRYVHDTSTNNYGKKNIEVTEPHYSGKTVSDLITRLLKYEGKELAFAGSTSKLGEINFDGMKVVKSSNMSSRYKKETSTDRGNNDSIGEINASIKTASDLMSSELDTDGTCTAGCDTRFVYEQDVTRYITEKLRNDYFDTLTLGLNTNIFSSYLMGKKTLDEIFSENNVTNKNAQNRIKFAYEGVKKVFEKYGESINNDDYYVLSLEELSNLTSGETGLFKLIGMTGGPSESQSWKIEYVKGLGSASNVGRNNESLANMRLHSVLAMLKGKDITFKEKDGGAEKDYNTWAVFKGSDSYIADTKETGSTRNFENSVVSSTYVSKPNQKCGRCSCVLLKVSRMPKCEKDEFEQDGDVFYDDKTKLGRIRCVRRAMASEEVSPNQTPVIEESTSSTRTCKEYTHTPDKEYQYFNKLKIDDPLLFTRITKKFKYFDPAFHSITPEGFNGRLTFLQQCTRQGPTTSTSDSGVVSGIGAGNLAFGTQPYCVIRIGDFFNTKAIIESVDIQFDTNSISWDLNQEGIGVQPMYAKVSLRVVLLGGSDIVAPISRLQNAISSNYYANASVYDKNALRDADNEINYFKARQGTGGEQGKTKS